MDSLQDRVNVLRRGPGAVVPSMPPPSPSGSVQQLPLWEERVRGLPNSIARSALFTIGNRADPRTQHKDARIFAIKGIEMQYTGEELRGADEDLFLQLLHLARLQPLAEGVDFYACAVLRALGRSTGKKEYDALRASISRLKANSLKITIRSGTPGERGFSGSLIRKFSWAGDERWKVWFEPEIVKLFGEAEFTKLDWEQRKRLSSMAKKLHTFYHSHRQPFGYYVRTLHSICRSRTVELFKFRYRLRHALEELQREGFLIGWSIDVNDVVHVVRAGGRIDNLQHAAIEAL